jgi:hypothetical protein
MRAAMRTKTNKMQKYAEFNIEAELRDKISFYPLIMESSGAVEESGMQFWKQRAKESVEVKGLPEAVIYTYLLKRLSCALQKGVAEVIHNRLYGIMCTPGKTWTRQAATEDLADSQALHAPPQTFRLGDYEEE